MIALETFAQAGAEVIETELSGMLALKEAFEGKFGEEFERAVGMIRKTSRNVVVTGIGKSGHIGRKIAATLASTGTNSIFVHAAEASHGDLGMIHAEDIVLALSWSGETRELSDIISYTRRFSIGLIAITGVAGGTLAQRADVALVIPPIKEACPNGLAPTTSAMLQLVVGDALAIALLKARGFTATDFGKFHPGGKLGSQLCQLHEVMRKRPEVPEVRPTALVGEALVQMSQFGLGYTLVVDENDRLNGIITDGDLRRNMSPDLAARPVTQIMSSSPKLLEPHMLAAEALAFLNQNKITAAPVVSAGKAVGGVHMVDFVKFGVI